MNTPNDPSNPQPAPNSANPPPTPPPLAPDAGFGVILDALLKRPLVLVGSLCDPKPSRHWLLLALVAVPAFALYGLLVG